MTWRERQAALFDVALGDAAAARRLAPDVREGAIAADRRLDVYRSLVAEAHLESLSSTFPVVAAVLGDRYWHQLVRASWPRPGSDDADLGRYGAFVPALLASAVAAQPELADYAYLPELASLEWSVHEAESRTGGPLFDWGAFAALPAEEQERRTLLPHPALTLLRLEAPVDEVWRRHRAPERASAETPPGRRLACAVHPEGRFGVGVARVTPEALPLLESILTGASLASLAAEHAALPDLMERLHGYIGDGWIAGIAAQR